jgi:hypothetical protein
MVCAGKTCVKAIARKAISHTLRRYALISFGFCSHANLDYHELLEWAFLIVDASAYSSASLVHCHFSEVINTFARRI